MAGSASALVFAAAATGAGGSFSCAVSAPRPASPQATANGLLVEPGARSLLLCRYRGFNPAATARRLQTQRLIASRTEMAAIGTALNALPALRAGVHCPLDDGSEIVATFGYASRAAIVVRIGLTGCRTVEAGRLPIRTAARAGGRRVISTLLAFLR